MKASSESGEWATVILGMVRDRLRLGYLTAAARRGGRAAALRPAGRAALLVFARPAGALAVGLVGPPPRATDFAVEERLAKGRAAPREALGAAAFLPEALTFAPAAS